MTTNLNLIKNIHALRIFCNFTAHKQTYNKTYVYYMNCSSKYNTSLISFLSHCRQLYKSKNLSKHRKKTTCNTKIVLCLFVNTKFVLCLFAKN